VKAPGSVGFSGPFADGQLRPASDIERFVAEHVTGKAVGSKVPLVAFDLDRMSPAAFAALRQVSPSFANAGDQLHISARTLKHIGERRGKYAEAVFADIANIVQRPDKIWPNPNRPDAPWARPWLVRETGSGTAAIVEVRPTGDGIDVVSVVAPIGDNQRRKATELLEELGPEGRKPTEVDYTPHPRSAEAPPPASDFPGLGPESSIGARRVEINFARIDEPDDVKKVMDDNPARRQPPLTPKQRAERKAGVQSFITDKRWLPEWGAYPTEPRSRWRGRPRWRGNGGKSERCWWSCDVEGTPLKIARPRASDVADGTAGVPDR